MPGKPRDPSGFWEWKLDVEVFHQFTLFALHYGTRVVEPGAAAGAMLRSSERQKAVCRGIAEALGKPGRGEKCQGVAAGIRVAGLAFCPWFSFYPDVPLFALASLTFFAEKVRRCGVGFPVCWDSPGPGEVPALRECTSS